MLTRVKAHGRIAACGAISGQSAPVLLYASLTQLKGYNDPSVNVYPNFTQIITNRLTVQGFIVTDFFSRLGEAIQGLSGALKSGQLKLEGAETLIKSPFEGIPETWGTLFTGGNTGKLVTQIAEL